MHQIPDGMASCRVGDDLLPELPPGWPVTVDTEGSGLHVDGDPVPSSSKPAAPAARISAVSVSFRWPVPNGDGTYYEGQLVDFAWPFDQGPVLGKPGKPVKDPETGLVTFEPIDGAEQARILAASSKVLGFEVTPELACPNLHPDHYRALVGWLDRRDHLTAHNSVHDIHQFRAGLRADAGGFGGPDGLYAWDVDTLVGRWQPDHPREIWSLDSRMKIRLHGGEMVELPRLGWMDPSPWELPIGERRRHIHCTMVVQKQLIDPLEVAALKPTSKRLWGEDEGTEAEELKAELARVGVGMTKRYDLLPWCGAVGRYAAKDTNLAHRLREYQDAAREEGAVLPNFDELLRTELALRTTLYRMERRGVAYNAEASFAQGAELRERCRALAATMPFDPSKPNSAKRYYFGPVCDRPELLDGGEGADAFVFHDKNCPGCSGKNGLGYEPLSRTEKTQAPQLDIQGVHALAEKGAPWTAEYLLYTKMRNSDSKWYTGWAARTGDDGRIRTQYKQCMNEANRAGDAGGGTKSGRLAVGFWQCQAIPHGHLIPEGAQPVRGYIGDEPGWVQYEHDLATGEMRVVTVIAGSTKMWDAIDAGADLHAMNARALFREKGDPSHPKFKQFRNAAKRGTFGIIYGGGPMALKEQIEAASGEKISLNDVKAAIQAFFETYPEFKRMADQATYKVSRWMGGPGYLTMLDGWRRWYAYNEKSHSAVNQVIQGNLARAMIVWMCEVEKELPDVLLLQIHDSLVTRHRDTPEGHAQAQRVSDIGERVFRKYFDVRGRLMTWGIEPDRWTADK